MSNVINYAESFLPYLIQMYEADMKSYGLTLSNPQVQWINARTINVPNMVLSGYKDHSRQGLFNQGSVKNTYTAYTLDHDRDIEFRFDAMDVDETNLAVSVANIQSTFEKEQAIPEKDSYRFSKLYQDFVEYGGTVDTTAITVANALEWFDTQMENMDDAGVPEEGRILYLTPNMYKIFKEAQGLTRVMHVNGAEINSPVNRKIWDLDDVELVKVPKARFKTAYDFSDGCVPDDDAKQINAILVHPDSVVARDRYEYIKMFTPGADAYVGDDYVYQNRNYGDLFVLKARLAGIAINAEAGSASN